MEFQAVLLAGGRGSRLTELTASVPKPLLPVGNRPMIWYPLNLLERAGFEEVIIITTKEVRNQLNTFPALSTKIHLDYQIIPEDSDSSTADSLRLVRKRIKTNVLVVSCDLVTDACLQPLVDLFRLRNAALVALVRQVDEPTEPIPGQKGKRPHEQRDFVGLDESGTRLLSLASEADLDDDLSLKKSLLCRFSRIHIKTNLMDAHLYCLKKWVLDLLAEEKSISSVKGELVPFLVKKQFSAPLGQKDLHAFIPADGLAGLAQERSAWDETEAAGRHGGAIRCYVHQLRGGLCLRANTLASYVEANKQVARVLPSLMVAEECLIHPSASISEKSQVGADSMVGRETQVEERTSVKRSVVGDYCVVRLRSKITSSIVMHRVTIGEGCNIQGSVLCEGAVLGAGVELKDCLVGSRIEVEPRVKRTNEIIERMIMI
uniref:translation initiation factor eIF2B subunit gamma isoform X1 n=1 Tax=Myxine glutinosa TaxID=7769 RepID=UPI00358EBA99